jgi:hypothetical protein
MSPLGLPDAGPVGEAAARDAFVGLDVARARGVDDRGRQRRRRRLGIDTIFESYDADGNGQLTRDEAAADLRLDARPLPVLLEDPDAVDWTRLRARLGPAAILLADVLPPLGE